MGISGHTQWRSATREPITKVYVGMSGYSKKALSDTMFLCIYNHFSSRPFSHTNTNIPHCFHYYKCWMTELWWRVVVVAVMRKRSQQAKKKVKDSEIRRSKCICVCVCGCIHCACTIFPLFPWNSALFLFPSHPNGLFILYVHQTLLSLSFNHLLC